MAAANGGDALPLLRDIEASRWGALARRRIFFGHQSVGINIVNGIADVLADHPEIGLNVLESRDVADTQGFSHARVGRNDHPLEKLEDFAAIATAGFAEQRGVAMVKLCYADFQEDTDPHALFGEYLRRVKQLKADNPLLTVVHFTVPLTIVENWKGRVRAALTGGITQRRRNVVRHRYNELARREFLGREPLFDIARLESTRPDGSRVHVTSDGETAEALSSEYTDDGGHLNARARRLVAEQLLILLARLETNGHSADRRE